MTAAGDQAHLRHAMEPELSQLFREAKKMAAFAVGSAAARDSLPLSVALERTRREICFAARACAVPPAELEEILEAALSEVPQGLEGRALERRLLAEVRQGLAAWRATMARWDRKDVEFARALEEGGIVPRLGRPKRGRLRR